MSLSDFFSGAGDFLDKGADLYFKAEALEAENSRLDSAADAQAAASALSYTQYQQRALAAESEAAAMREKQGWILGASAAALMIVLVLLRKG